MTRALAVSRPSRLRHAPARPLAGALAVLMLALLGGCGTAPRAPVEGRDGQEYKAPISSSFYEVERGDTLWSIAWRAGLDYRQVSDWNRLPPPYTIYPGQRLRLTPPYGSAKTAAAPVRTRPAAAPEPPRVRPTPAASRPATDAPSEARPAPIRAAPASAPEPPAPPEPPVSAPAALRWQWPTAGKVVQGFVPGDPGRKGIRISGALGQDVAAAEAGRVVYSGSGLIGYGRLIIVKHNKDYLSAYGYNRRILVKEGDQVTRGERIAEMGSTSGNAPMLHFEIRRRGKPVDPVRLLPPR